MVYAKFERQTECVMGISRVGTGQNNMHKLLFSSALGNMQCFQEHLNGLCKI